jgi:endonuclease/exonuclease/phosphatase family metal-dependent hydrolase
MYFPRPRPLLFPVAILCFLFLASASARTLKVASWNVENLFDLRVQGTEYLEYLPGRHGWSERMLEKKLRNLSQVICDLDADVIALQEVENDGILARLQRYLKRVGCPYPYRAITTGAGRPVHVALLSRVKIAAKREIPVSRAGRERRILEATLATEPPLRLFVNHWRSKRGPESERIRYAKALKRRLERLPAGSEYLILGDFNSDYREYRVIDRKHDDTGGRTGINHVLGTIDSRGRMIRRETLRDEASRGVRHLNLWMELESGSRWSHNFYGDKEAIDAILIPPSLADGRGWEYRPGSFGVFRPPYLFGSRGEVKRWEYRHGKHRGRGFSDHLPVHALFETLEKKPGAANLSAVSSSPARAAPRAVGISDLLKRRKLETPVRLEGAVLIFRRGRHGVLQRTPEGPAILLYGAAGGLEEGRSYDLTIYGFKRYRGMPEITDLEVESVGPKRETRNYISPFRPEMMERQGWIGRIVREIRGEYRHGKILTGGRAVPIHFKKRARRPKEGAFLRIKRAQIGYYRDHTELVVWDRSDYETARK